MFTTEDDPETEERGVEDALLNVFEQQHPCPLKAQGEPLHWHVQERHRDTQSKNHPVQGKYMQQVTLCCRQSIDLVLTGQPRTFSFAVLST